MLAANKLATDHAGQVIQSERNRNHKMKKRILTIYQEIPARRLQADR